MVFEVRRKRLLRIRIVQYEAKPAQQEFYLQRGQVDDKALISKISTLKCFGRLLSFPLQGLPHQTEAVLTYAALGGS